jgi:protein-disulfide isomerase
MANGGPHPASCEAAVAVRLAREQGKEDPMIEWVFANQDKLTPDVIKQGVQETGGVTDFDAKYSSTLALVKVDAALGQRLTVRSTPTFFLNGVKLEGALPVQYFEQAILYELQHAK